MNLRALLQCPPNQVEDKDPFFIQVYSNKEFILYTDINNNNFLIIRFLELWSTFILSIQIDI